MKRLTFLVMIIVTFVLAGCEGVWKPPVRCPLPRIASEVDCFKCHVEGDFRVKETAADAHRVYPVVGMRVVGSEGRFFLYAVSSPDVSAFFDYLDNHGIKKAVMEIHSPGGSIFEMQRIVGLMRHFQSHGGKIETRIYGAALSAAFYIFVAGDVRLVDENADLMWHQLQMEGNEDLKRHLEGIRNRYLASRSKLTLAQIEKKIAERAWWMSGKEAVKLGFATGYLSGKVK